MKTKGLCVLVALLSTCWTCVAQVGETKELPKKAKLARISYSGYEITGYVYKKQFVEGQRLLIKAYQDGTGDDTIAEGVYSVTNAGPCLDGLVKRGSGGFTWKGTFKIVNNTFGELTPRRSFWEENELVITPLHLHYIEWYSKDFIPFVLQEQSNGDYSLNMFYEGCILEEFFSASAIKKVQTFNSPYYPLRKSVFTNFDDILDGVGIGFTDTDTVRLYYDNGDRFRGILLHGQPKKGEFRFKNGEIFRGAMGNNIFGPLNDVAKQPIEEILNHLRKGGGLPLASETVFSDETTAKGYWGRCSETYTEEGQEWLAAIDTCQSLTSMRNVTVLLEERDLQRQAEEEKQMAEKKQKEEAKSREIITKYGEFYGKMILQNKLVTGMTKAMVNEVWPKEFFNHGKTIYNGKEVEQWIFDKELMYAEILKLSYAADAVEEAQGVIAAMELSAALGGPKMPQKILFENNKVIRVFY